LPNEAKSDEVRKPFVINKKMNAFIEMEPDSIIVKLESKGKQVVSKHFTDISHAVSYIEDIKQHFGGDEDGD
jgi:hypothetical protein